MKKKVDVKMGIEEFKFKMDPKIDREIHPASSQKAHN